MRYIITESQFEKLMETEDRTSGMVKRFLDMTFANMVRVGDEDGPGYKFDGDNQYQVKVRKNNAGEPQLAISSSFVKNIMSMFDVNKFEASELIGEYCSDVLDIDFDFTRIWPISINEEISEVKKSEDFDEYSPVYRYKSIKVNTNPFNPDEIENIFFNGEWQVKTDYLPSKENVFITFTGPNGDFKFDSNVVNQAKNGNPYVRRMNLNNVYYDRLLRLMKEKNPPKQTSYNSSEIKQDDSFTGPEIKKALEMAFPNNWNKETDDYSAGVRGIHTIGEMNDTDEDWSIMNYFDTKNEVKKLINDKWDEEGSGDKIKWLSSVFQNDDEFVNKLLDKQWNSIKGGFKTENHGLENLIKMLEESGESFKYEVYPPGHKTDRFGAIDLKLQIENEPPITIQIKPLTKLEKSRTKSDTYKVHTYGMNNYYKNKKDLDYILYNKGDGFIMFNNKKYYVSDSGTEVIHYMKPYKVYNMNIDL